VLLPLIGVHGVQSGEANADITNSFHDIINEIQDITYVHIMNFRLSRAVAMPL